MDSPLSFHSLVPYINKIYRDILTACITVTWILSKWPSSLQQFPINPPYLHYRFFPNTNSRIDCLCTINVTRYSPVASHLNGRKGTDLSLQYRTDHLSLLNLALYTLSSPCFSCFLGCADYMSYLGTFSFAVLPVRVFILSFPLLSQIPSLQWILPLPSCLKL